MNHDQPISPWSTHAAFEATKWFPFGFQDISSGLHHSVAATGKSKAWLLDHQGLYWAQKYIGIIYRVITILNISNHLVLWFLGLQSSKKTGNPALNQPAIRWWLLGQKKLSWAEEPAKFFAKGKGAPRLQVPEALVLSVSLCLLCGAEGAEQRAGEPMSSCETPWGKFTIVKYCWMSWIWTLFSLSIKHTEGTIDVTIGWQFVTKHCDSY